MNIICPECGKSHKLPDDRLPTRKSVARCKKCAAKMVIYPRPILPPTVNIEPETLEAVDESLNREFDVILTEDDRDRKGNGLGIAQEDSGGGRQPRKVAGDEESSREEEILGAFPEIGQLSPGIFDLLGIFSIEGKRGYRNRNNILKSRLIKATHDLLTRSILHENERVLRLARGIAYYPFEIPYANGLLTMLSNYYAIVCTNERLLLINIDCRLTGPTRYVFQIFYEQINDISRGAFLSSLIIDLKEGPGWNFTNLGRASAKEMRGFIIEQGKASSASSATGDESADQLCPACFTPLTRGLSSCPRCQAAFKKSDEAIIRSLILPGLGSIYLTFLPLGLLEMVGYILTWLVAVILMIMAVPGGLGAAAVPVVAYHLIAGLLARKTYGKGYILEK